MNLNKLAEEVFKMSYQDEFNKLAAGSAGRASDLGNLVADYAPAAVGIAALPLLVHHGSILGRNVGFGHLGDISDYLHMSLYPQHSIAERLGGYLGARTTLGNIGTIAGALAGTAGAYGLYKLLQHSLSE